MSEENNSQTHLKYFFGTAATIIITLFIAFFGHLFNQMNYLQNAINDSVRKSEFNERTTSIWTSIRSFDNLKEKTEIINSLKEKIIQLEQDLKQYNKDNIILREKIAALENIKK
jgi:CII-binding regulator of phage lambda lysogenization HflD